MKGREMATPQSETTNAFDMPIEPAMHVWAFYNNRVRQMVSDNLFNRRLKENESRASYYYSLSSGRYEIT